MRGKRRLMHRAAMAAALVAVAVLGIAGCSTVGPESSWAGNEGSISGTVRSDTGSALVGIDVRLRGQTSDGECVDYTATTGATGTYSVVGVELGQAHAYEMDYAVYVNRTTSSAMPLVSNYGTHVATVAVTTSGTSYDVVIVGQGPGIPVDFIE
ncbi:MAG: hypothetical protein ABIG03_02700 [Candidatus Eisenbacteria bacterium]